MEAIMLNSKKVIYLDGDISNRTYALINKIGKSINIVNDIKINKKTLKLTNDDNYYISKMYEDLDNNKNIVIVSMSATECKNYYSILKNKYPEKKILVYHGQSDDKDKDDLKDVLIHWKDADVIIYSPTIESGVNFDLVHFYKIYAIIVSGSTSQRAFLQMLSRVRKVENDEVLCLTKLELNYTKFYQFNEVKDSLIRMEAIHVHNEYITNAEGMIRILKPNNYDINYIYNKVENLNQCSYGFLFYLQYLCNEKGYEFIYHNEPKCKLLDLPIQIRDVLVAADVDEDEYFSLLEKQQSSIATKDDKIIVERHILKRLYGVDNLDSTILDTFNKEKINNYIHLLDCSNIIIGKDHQTTETFRKVELLNNLISKIGFTHMFDDQKIDSTTFNEKMSLIIKENILFTDQLGTKVLFNLEKSKKIEIKTTKAFLGFVNTLLSNYCLKISVHRKNIKVKKLVIKSNSYYLEHLDNIEEIIQYKKDKKYYLLDSKNIFKWNQNIKPPKYNHLLK